MKRHKFLKKFVAGLCMVSMLFSTGAAGVVSTAAEADDPDETATKYTVLLEDSENGKVQFSDSEETSLEFTPGDTVSLSLTANDGYEVAGIVISDAETGEELASEEGDYDTYTFTMPEANLKVTGSFVESEDTANDVEESTTETEVSDEVQEIAEEIHQKALAANPVTNSASLYSAARTLAAGDSVYLNVGADYWYDSYVTNIFTIGGNNAFCVEPSKGTPSAGTYTAQEAYTVDGEGYGALDVKYLEAAVWFSYGSPGYDESMWPSTYYDGSSMGSEELYIASHLLVSKVFSNSSSVIRAGVSDLYYQWYWTEVTGSYANGANADSTWEQVKARVDEVPDTFEIFFVNTNSSTQIIVGWEYNPTGYLSLNKSSSNTSITSGNDCYSLEGARYGVYSDSSCTNRVATLTTDENGNSNTVELDAGTYYVKEISASEGYYLDETVYTVTISSEETTYVKVSEVPGNDPAAISIYKVDAETGEASAQGGASLAGAQFTINYYDGYYTEDTLPSTPTRTWVIETKETTLNGETVYRTGLSDTYKVSGDAFYYSDGIPTLPLGTITVEETKAPEGYLLDGATFTTAEGDEITGVYVSQITMDSNVVSLKGGNEYYVADQVIRGDFELTKIAEDTQNTMAGVQFEITSNATGESHVIITDENGYYSSSSSYNKHTTDTNGGTAESGLWFGDSDPDDDLGALPYGTYTITELEGDANEGKQMYEGTLTISRDGFTISLGTIENHSKPTIGTTAKNEATNNHYAQAEDQVVIIDTVSFSGLTTGEEYTVTGTLMDKETGEAVLDSDGNAVTAETTFTADTPAGTVEVEFIFDASDLGGHDVVVFEELYLGTELIAEHEDIEDTDQTVHFPEIGTTAIDSETGTNVTNADEEITIVDTVEYSNVAPGYKYTITGTLVDQETGEPVLDDDGNEITASTTFTPEESSGTVEVTFTFSGVNLAGETIVAFETLERNDKVYAVHADLEDEAQTVYIPKISTQATDSETGMQNSYADGEFTIIDTVSYENLIPGQTYTMTGTLMDASTGKPLVDDDGNKVTATQEFVANEETKTVSYTEEVVSGVDENGESVGDRVDFTCEECGETFSSTIAERDTALAQIEEHVAGHELKPGYGTVDMTFTFSKADLEGATLVVFEKLYMEEAEVAYHEDIEDEGQTIYVPKIGTQATDSETGTQTSLADEEVTIIDTVSYENLIPGKEYVVTGTLYDKETGEAITVDGEEVTASTTFTPEESSGTVDVTFVFDGSALAGKTVVAFEDVYYEDVKVATHADINDEDQSVYFPEIGTIASDGDDGDNEAYADDVVTIIDTVDYSNLTPGVEYEVVGTIMIKSTGEALIANGTEVTASATFTPDEPDGSVDVTFTFDGTGLDGEDLVVFEKLYLAGKEIANHEDLADEGQTVSLVAPPEDAESTPTGSNNVQTGDTWYMYGALAAAVVLIVAGVILLRKKKGTDTK